MRTIENPVVDSFSEADASLGIPSIVEVFQDMRSLRLTLRFNEVDTTSYVEFNGVRGFRVLDEGDLTEFWHPGVRAKGWLWRVHSGGWRDLERIRQSFISGAFGDLGEYLVLGEDDCVSVLTNQPPIIRVAGS